jgi:PRTRC genetic system protein A
MNADTLLPAYLDNPIDRATMGLTPCLMVPIRGELPPLAVGGVRYLVAAGGLYLEARSRGLHACVQIAGTSLPYGEVETHVTLAGGPLPYSLYQVMEAMARRASPAEWGCVVWWDEQARTYHLWEPGLAGYAADSSRLQYTRPPANLISPLDIVLDLHSHARLGAFFSGQDDIDDRSFEGPLVFAAVLGKLGGDFPITEQVCRLVINGKFFPLPWMPWKNQA